MRPCSTGTEGTAWTEGPEKTPDKDSQFQELGTVCAKAQGPRGLAGSREASRRAGQGLRGEEAEQRAGSQAFQDPTARQGVSTGMAERVCPGHGHPGTICTAQPGPEPARRRRPALPRRAYETQRNRSPRFFNAKHMCQPTKDLVFLPYNNEVEEYSPRPHGNIRLFKRKYYY